MFSIRVGLIQPPWNASRFCFPERGAKTLQFIGSQEAFTAALLKLFDSACRIDPLRHNARTARVGVHAADHSQHSIGLEGGGGKRGMQSADLESCQLVRL